jgi:hydrogenase maturation protease
MADVLVIGYGNPLRGDDGIGPAVAADVARLGLPGVRVLEDHQLTPELAAELAEVQLAVFVDAAVGGDPVTCVRLEATAAAAAMTHAADPRALLALARALYGRVPEAWLVTAGGEDFGFRDGLSPTGRENACRAVSRVGGLIREATGARGRARADRTGDR